MPKAFSEEFRADVIAAVRNRTGSTASVAASFGVSSSCVQRSGLSCTTDSDI